jgi:hypothetical protein
MNCQDITRLIDSGKFSEIPATDRRDAEAHAKICSHCAPLWIMHASLSSTRRPPMPAELSVRCLTLAAAQTHAVSPRRMSRVTVVTAGLVVFAAAASMLATGVFDRPAPPEPLRVSEPAIAVEQALLPVETALAPPAAAESQTVETLAPRYSLPLIPAPVGADAQRKAQRDLAIRKALELYPAITQGPEIDGVFVVSLNLRADGTVLENTLAIAHSTEEVNTLMHKMKPVDDFRTFTGVAKGARQEDGSMLKGNLSVDFSVVPNGFDLLRAGARVEEIVRAERAHLMLPLTKGGMNTLTVLLADDGTIQRENVEFMGRAQMQSQAQKPVDAEGRAREMARKLGVGVEQIGLMGTARIHNGSTDNATIAYLMIDYAWARRPGELAASLGQDENKVFGSGVDEAAALVVVERMMPEVFLQAERPTSGPSTNAPTIAFTTEGRVIGVGRVNLQSRESAAQQVQKFTSGVEVYSGRGVSVRNADGRSAEVQFFWEASPAQKAEMEKSRNSTAK